MLCLSRILFLVKLLVAFDGKPPKILCEIKDPNNNLALNNALTICLARSKIYLVHRPDILPLAIKVDENIIEKISLSELSDYEEIREVIPTFFYIDKINYRIFSNYIYSENFSIIR